MSTFSYTLSDGRTVILRYGAALEYFCTLLGDTPNPLRDLVMLWIEQAGSLAGMKLEQERATLAQQMVDAPRSEDVWLQATRDLIRRATVDPVIVYDLAEIPALVATGTRVAYIGEYRDHLQELRWAATGVPPAIIRFLLDGDAEADQPANVAVEPQPARQKRRRQSESVSQNPA